ASGEKSSLHSLPGIGVSAGLCGPFCALLFGLVFGERNVMSTRRKSAHSVLAGSMTKKGHCLYFVMAGHSRSKNGVLRTPTHKAGHDGDFAVFTGHPLWVTSGQSETDLPKQKDRLAAVFPEFSLLRSRSECCCFLLPTPAEQAESAEAGTE